MRAFREALGPFLQDERGRRPCWSESWGGERGVSTTEHGGWVAAHHPTTVALRALSYFS